MPLVFFMAPNDPRMLQTIDAMPRPRREGGLSADGLDYRYDPRIAPDGLPGEAFGNFPQALTHLGLVSAASNLDRALGWSGAE